MAVKCLVTFIGLIFEVVSVIPWGRDRWAWNVQTSSFSVYFLNWNGSEPCVSKFPMSAEAWAFQPIQFGGYYPNPSPFASPSLFWRTENTNNMEAIKNKWLLHRTGGKRLESHYFKLHSWALVYNNPTHPKQPEGFHLGMSVPVC